MRVTHCTKNVEQLLEVRERIDQFVYNARKCLMQGMVVHGREVKIEGHLRAFGGYVQQTVFDAFMDLTEVFWRMIASKRRGAV